MDSSWNIGSIGISGPPLRGPSSSRLFAEPPLSPPVSAGSSPTASAQPLEPAAPFAPAMPSSVETSPAASAPDPAQRPAASLESLLMRFRLITSEQLDEAMREKLETGKDVGAIVVERGWVNEDQLARLLSYAPAFTPPAEPAQEESAPQSSPAGVAVEPENEPEAFAAESPWQSEPEPEGPLAGAVVSAERETPAEEHSAEESIASTAHEVAPALELIELEPTADAGPQLEAPTSFSEAHLPVTSPAEPEPAAEPVAPEALAELAPLAPVQPAPEPVFEPTVEPEPEAVAVTLPEISPPVDQPELQPEPAPEPETQPERENAPAAEAVAVAGPRAVRFVEPPAIETIARVFVRLSNGDRVEAGSFDDVGAAKARAEEVVREISQDGNGWPFFGGRYIRPDVIVSVDVDATVVRYS